MDTCSGRTPREWDWLYEGSFILKWGSSSAGKDKKDLLIHSSNQAKNVKSEEMTSSGASDVINLSFIGQDSTWLLAAAPNLSGLCPELPPENLNWEYFLV